MSTVIDMSPSEKSRGNLNSIVDDFAYGSNVASASVYIRMGFLRKVYGILSVQLLFTTLVGLVCTTVEPVRDFVQQSQWLVMLSAVMSFGLIFALMVKSREVPTNFILLGLFTLCESVLVGTIVTFYEKHSVLEAFVLTCAVTVALTVYTLQSKKDFSHWGAALFSALWLMILTAFLQVFIFPGSEMMDRGIGFAGALLFSLFIIFDTQMIMKKVSPEDYIHAAINLYLDIINLFLHILRLMGERK